jgi:hypothetical protein
MMGVALLFQYVIANDVAAILFIGINMYAMVSWFRKPLRQFYALTAEPVAYRWGFVGGVAVSTIGYLFVYLICQDVIRISFLQGRTIEEMGMLYLLFYVPFLMLIAKCHTMGARMERVWER